MRSLFKLNILTLSIAIAVLVPAFLLYNFPSADASSSKFIEKVGEGFMAPACGSSSVTDFICNADGTVTAKIHWYPKENIAATECADGISNEENDEDWWHDNLIDMADPQCANSKDNTETDIAPSPPFTQLIRYAVYTECADGIDNDGDGRTDYPNDPGCIWGYAASSESADVPQCSDGADNPRWADDGDGGSFPIYNNLKDYPQDPGCASPYDDVEYSAAINLAAECFDGIDNDWNSLTDYPADPGCVSALDPQEWNPLSWCQYVNFFDVDLSVYFGVGTPCYKGSGEGFLWPTFLLPNTAQQYRAYTFNDNRVYGGHVFNKASNPPSGTVSFTTPTCSASDFTLTVNSAGAAGVDITSSTGHGGTTNYQKTNLASGAGVSLTAPAVAGFTFDGWSGACAGGNPCNLTMDSNKIVFADYTSVFTTGDVKIKRVGSDDTTSTAPADSNAKLDSSAPTASNPADYLSISTGPHTAYAAGVSGYAVTVGQCSYTILECDVASFDPASCSVGFCDLPIVVNADETQKVVFKYVTVSQICGNGFIEGTETCDDGANNGNTCPAACSSSCATNVFPECSDCVDNTDPEDNLIDCADSACHTDGNVNNASSCLPSRGNENNSTFREIFIPFRRALAMMFGI